MASRNPAASLLALALALAPTCAQAFTLLASYGKFKQDAAASTFTAFEASQDKAGLANFELTNLNHFESSKAHVDSLQAVYRGLGFELARLRLNIDLGYYFSIDKYVLDEIDYGISRSIVGGGITLDASLIELHGFSRSFIPKGSQKARIDSFSFSFNPSTYQQSELGIALTLGPLRCSADLGRLDHLRGRYDILGENFAVSAPAVSYAKGALLLEGQSHTALRLELHQRLGRQDKNSEFHKLIGAALHRDAYDGGALGFGFSF